MSWVVPTVQFSAATWVPGTAAHSGQAVAAGDVTHDMPWAPSVAVSISPRIDGGLLLPGK